MKKKSLAIQKTIEMKATDADKWMAALRSGKYKRGEGSLIDTEVDQNTGTYKIEYVYCCMGVMQCELGKIEENRQLPSKKWLKKHKIKVVPSNDNKEIDIALNPPVNGYNSVAKLNDSGKYSFKSIADILDKRIKRV